MTDQLFDEMKPNDFKIKFGMHSHEIDVNVLISSLMYTSNLIQEINRELDTDKKIDIKIKALEKGSFEIHIELIESLLKSMFSSETISYADNIISILGGLYGFANFLKGSKPTVVNEIKDNQINIVNENGEKTTITNNVYNIYMNNTSVRKTIAKQFSSMQTSDEIDSFEIQDWQENTISVINAVDFPDLSSSIDPLKNEHENLVQIKTEQKMLIIRPSFTKDLKWDLVYKGTRISAFMKDEELIKAIDRGDNFSKGDLMVVDLEITKYYDKDIGAHMITKDSYKILKFIEHIKNDKIGNLFDEDL